METFINSNGKTRLTCWGKTQKYYPKMAAKRCCWLTNIDRKDVSKLVPEYKKTETGKTNRFFSDYGQIRITRVFLVKGFMARWENGTPDKNQFTVFFKFEPVKS